MRIDPSNLGSKTYELYRTVSLEGGDRTKERKTRNSYSLVIAEIGKAQIREKVFDQIPINVDDRLDTLIAFLDYHLKKNDLADGLEKFDEFEDFQQKSDVSITEYITSFDLR